MSELLSCEAYDLETEEVEVARHRESGAEGNCRQLIPALTEIYFKAYLA